MARTCSIEVCDESRYSRGLCKAHYQRWLDKGDPGTSPIVKKRPGSTCDVVGCCRAHYAKRLCRSHYNRLSTTGEIGGIDFIVHPVPREHLGYVTQHKRLRSDLGPAENYSCVSCGSHARQWAYQHTDPDEMFDDLGLPYSDSAEHYAPMCVSCHIRFDRGSLIATWAVSQ